VACSVARRISDHDHATIEKADTQDAFFAVVTSVVFDLERKSLEDLSSSLEI
jgi:hypothetical protein